MKDYSQNYVDYTRYILSNKIENNKIIAKLANQYEVILQPQIELTSYSLVSEFAKIGLDIDYVTKDYLTKELTNQELFILNIKENIPPRHLGIITSKTHLSSFSTKKLMEIILKK